VQHNVAESSLHDEVVASGHRLKFNKRLGHRPPLSSREIAEEDAHLSIGDGFYDSDVFDVPLAQPDVVRYNKRGPSEELVVVERRVSRRLS
jgi:hypothetical protein